MIHVQILDEELWYLNFVDGMTSIFRKNDEIRSEKMYNYFMKLIDEKPGELKDHFRKFYQGRYPDSDDGIDLRDGIERRHDSALGKAIRKFPDEFWTAVIADMIMWSKQEGKITDAKIVHELIIPMHSGIKDPDVFKKEL